MRWVLSLVAMSLVGCVAEENVATSTQSIVVDNRLSGNRLSGNRLSGNRLSGNRLSGNRLSGNRLELNAAGSDLLATADGRDVLTYIISCALPEGTTLVGTDPNPPYTQYEFFGEIGLAPGWLDQPLDRKGNGWVSACLFARVNAHDVAVPVSLRGPNLALTTSADERANWTEQEGAFYGMYFLPIDQPIAWFACSGRDATLALADERDCSTPDPARPGLTLCGFNYAGDCGDYAPPPNRTACRAFSANGYYVDCADHAQFLQHHHGVQHHHGHFDHASHDDGGDGDEEDDDDGGVFHQVITTFVLPH